MPNEVKDTPLPGVTIVGTRSTFYPETEDAMGWYISEKGFRIMLSPAVPQIIRDHFRSDTRFLQTHRLFHGDLVERVHRHLHIGDIDTRVIRLHTDLHVVVDHAFYWYQNPQSCLPSHSRYEV